MQNVAVNWGTRHEMAFATGHHEPSRTSSAQNLMADQIVKHEYQARSQRPTADRLRAARPSGRAARVPVRCWVALPIGFDSGYD